jgi:biopolymer transport protein ExbD/biopolymer transport protein TolR
MAYKLKAPETVADINVTPMVDVMLVLLIIFMVITPMLQHGVSVRLAQAQNSNPMPGAQKTNAVLIAVTRDGKLFLGTSPVRMSQITTKVRNRLATRINKVVYIKSDARAKYGEVTSVVDAIRAAGVEQLGLLTEQVQQRRPIAAAIPASP